MGTGMQGWIAETLDRGSAARGGSVGVAGPDGKAGFSVGFSGARLTSVTFPALDAASKEPATVAVEFVARQVTWGKGSGAAAEPDARSKEWLQSGFMVEIGDLPCRRVARVDAFTWNCAADGTVTVPDVRLVISRADLGLWEEAARRWFLDRDHRDKHEMNGRIALLAAECEGRGRRHRARQRRPEAVLARRGRGGPLRRGALRREGRAQRPRLTATGGAEVGETSGKACRAGRSGGRRVCLARQTEATSLK